VLDCNPIVTSGAGGYAIGRYEENIKVSGAAALKKSLIYSLSQFSLLQEIVLLKRLEQSNIPFDAELTPMSERAIKGDRVSDAESVYLILYDNKKSSDSMRAKVLY
jgi:hypothetical protein